METNYLLLAVLTATFGFIIWYSASATLRLPKAFQIQFDINTPYMNRFLRRRILMFILYVILPYLHLFVWKVIGNVSLTDLGINFTWNSSASLWTAILVPIAIIYNYFGSRSDANLTEFPEIRLTMWTSKLLLLSASTWVLQIFALEFLFRGLLLQSLRTYGLSDLISILLCTGIYALTQYFKSNILFLFSIVYGILSCYIVIQTGSLLPVILIHLVHALSKEWFSIWRHPEMRTV